MANAERLSRLSLVEKAVELADAESLESVTVRRLAQELGVTPMALYWHVKNKDQLLVCVADHLLTEVTAEFDAAAPWNARLRVMVEALVGVMRRHRYMPGLFTMVEKQELPSFRRATDTALNLLCEAGFTLSEGYSVSIYLLHGAMALVDSEPGHPEACSPEQAAESRRQKRLALELLPADQFPRIVEYARTMEEEPDVDAYYAFGLDLLMSGVEAMAAKRTPSSATQNNTR